MNRKPIFDAVRTLLGHGFSQDEIDALDRACDLAEAAVDHAPMAKPKPAMPAATASVGVGDHVLGGLSEEYESGGRGPGTVSGGHNDPGGVSYGVYQFASKARTCAVFCKAEGAPWAADWGAHAPGSEPFSAAWRAVAARENAAFRKAQHAFIVRTHYRPVVTAVAARKGLDLDSRSNAVRDVVWSCAVQHQGAANILIDAIDTVDQATDRRDPAYDRTLVEAIYARRIAYVLGVAANPKLKPGERNQLISITERRYPQERSRALAALDDGAAAPAPTASPALAPAGDSIDGNAVAAANGVAVKSAAVKIGKLHPMMGPAIVAVAGAAKALGLRQPVITSGNDSKHMAGSMHAKNRALDFRGNNIKVTVGQALAAQVAQRLGAGYDVIFETFLHPANNHLHVEYDPS